MHNTSNMKNLNIIAIALLLLAASSSASRYYTVKCSSYHFKPKACHLPHFVGPLHLVKKISRSSCTSGHSYFRGHRSIIVTNGCRAIFRYYPASRPVGLLYKLKTCSSTHFKPKFCYTESKIHRLLVAKRLSRSSCHPHKSYFNKNHGILVNKGCRATFVYGTKY